MQGVRYLYHDPCHSPMKLQDPMKTVRALVGDEAIKTDRCCGESGTLAVTRPDISTQVRFRKEEELGKNMATIRRDGLAEAHEEDTLGICGLAVPAWLGGDPAGAFAVAIPEVRYDARLAAKAKAALSRAAAALAG